jgi:hypothetical protein
MSLRQENGLKFRQRLPVLPEIFAELNDAVLLFSDLKAIEYLQTKKRSIRLPAGAST